MRRVFAYNVVHISKNVSLNPTRYLSASSTTQKSSNLLTKAEFLLKRENAERRKDIRVKKKETRERKSALEEEAQKAIEESYSEKKELTNEYTVGLAPIEEETIDEIYKELMLASPKDLMSAILIDDPSQNVQLQLSPVLQQHERATILTTIRDRLPQLPSLRLEADSVTSMQTIQEPLGVETTSGSDKSKSNHLVPSLTFSQKETRKFCDQLGELLKTNKEIHLSPIEWKTFLVQQAYQENSIKSVMKGLELLAQDDSIENKSEILTEVLKFYSYSMGGSSEKALAVATFAGANNIPLSTVSHHYLISSLNHKNIYQAVQYLYRLEAQGFTPLQETYNVVISRLLATISAPESRSLGWDLYAHMRFTAHPIPSPQIFSTMIKACSHSPPSPERAIDLFEEMTTTNKLAPTRLAYTGVIRACARSGKLDMYYKALQYLQQMIESSIIPDQKTFHAVLEGAAIFGDLARARWILVKMLQNLELLAPTHSTIGLVLRAYANFRPDQHKNFDKSKIQSLPNHQTESNPAKMSATNNALTILESFREGDFEYPGPLPGDSPQVLKEATGLFNQVIDSSSALFSNVRIFPFLINEYLGMVIKHTDNFHRLRNALDVFDNEYKRLRVSKNAHSYRYIMDAVASCPPLEFGGNGKQNIETMDRVFGEWIEWQKSVEEDLETISIMWALKIKTLMKFDQPIQAFNELHKFTKLYPPEAFIPKPSIAPFPLTREHVEIATDFYPETVGTNPARNLRSTFGRLIKYFTDAGDLSRVDRLKAKNLKYRTFKLTRDSPNTQNTHHAR